MLTAFDGFYTDTIARVAAGAVAEASVETVSRTCWCEVPVAGAYEPGAFFKRELPALQALWPQLSWTVSCIVVDGYVDLARGRPGFGRHVFDWLDGALPVIGVAKNAFSGNDVAKTVCRGGSTRPLYVTAAGMATSAAVDLVQALAGPHRLPTLLQTVDQLSKHTD